MSLGLSFLGGAAEYVADAFAYKGKMQSEYDVKTAMQEKEFEMRDKLAEKSFQRTFKKQQEDLKKKLRNQYASLSTRLGPDQKGIISLAAQHGSAGFDRLTKILDSAEAKGVKLDMGELFNFDPVGMESYLEGKGSTALMEEAIKIAAGESTLNLTFSETDFTKGLFKTEPTTKTTATGTIEFLEQAKSYYTNTGTLPTNLGGYAINNEDQLNKALEEAYKRKRKLSEMSVSSGNKYTSTDVKTDIGDGIDFIYENEGVAKISPFGSLEKFDLASIIESKKGKSISTFKSLVFNLENHFKLAHGVSNYDSETREITYTEAYGTANPNLIKEPRYNRRLITEIETNRSINIENLINVVDKYMPRVDNKINFKQPDPDANIDFEHAILGGRNGVRVFKIGEAFTDNGEAESYMTNRANFLNRAVGGKFLLGDIVLDDNNVPIAIHLGNGNFEYLYDRDLYFGK